MWFRELNWSFNQLSTFLLSACDSYDISTLIFVYQVYRIHYFSNHHNHEQLSDIAYSLAWSRHTFLIELSIIILIQSSSNPRTTTPALGRTTAINNSWIWRSPSPAWPWTIILLEIWRWKSKPSDSQSLKNADEPLWVTLHSLLLQWRGYLKAKRITQDS